MTARALQLRNRCVCAAEQHYVYAWDELARISEARRYDRIGGSLELAARMRYRYDGENQRVVKQVLASSGERIALYGCSGSPEGAAV